MSYSIKFKPASLKQIFADAANDYRQDCCDAVSEIIHKELPGDLIGLMSGKPAVWNMNGQLNDDLAQKLKALPFVVAVENDPPPGTPRPSRDMKQKIKDWVGRRIYL